MPTLDPCGSRQPGLIYGLGGPKLQVLLLGAQREAEPCGSCLGLYTLRTKYTVQLGLYAISSSSPNMEYGP